MATTNETKTASGAPSQNAPRVVQFRATDQDEAISALISSLDRRVGKRLEELNQENAGLRDRITELKGALADFAEKNSDLERTASGLRSELGNAMASLERAGQEKVESLGTISRLEEEAKARAQAKGGSTLAWIVGLLLAAAVVAVFLN